MVTLEEDIERVAAVKHALGKDCPLMLDANTNWDYHTALEAGRAFVRLVFISWKSRFGRTIMREVQGWLQNCPQRSQVMRQSA